MTVDQVRNAILACAVGFTVLISLAALGTTIGRTQISCETPTIAESVK